MFAGGILAYPRLRAEFQLKRADAVVLDVFSTPLGDGQQRLAVIYRWRLPETGEHWQLAWTQGDGRFLAVPDPVLPDGEVEAQVEAWLDQVRRPGTVWYDPSDPQGSAFIPALSGGRGSRRAETGLVLVALGIAWAWLTQRRS